MGIDIHQGLLGFGKLFNTLLFVVGRFLTRRPLNSNVVCLPVIINHVLPKGNPGYGMCPAAHPFVGLVRQFTLIHDGLTYALGHFTIVIIISWNYSDPFYFCFVLILYPESKTSK